MEGKRDIYIAEDSNGLTEKFEKLECRPPKIWARLDEQKQRYRLQKTINKWELVRNDV